MKLLSTVICAILLTHANGAPQFITYKDGKLGVNFGGYHAGVGIGGLLGDGTSGGLYAEAGTPTGQSAQAGLGGSVNRNGITSGGLFAGATAGNNIQASAGLAGGLAGEQTTGGGYAFSQAGNRYASTGLGGGSIEGTSEFQVTGVKNVNVIPAPNRVATEVIVNEINEVQPISKVEIHKTIIKERSHPPPPPPPPPPPHHHHTFIKEVSKPWSTHRSVFTVPSLKFHDMTSLYRLPRTHPVLNYPQVHVETHPALIEKEIIHTHYKPHRTHLKKTAFIGGYIGGQEGVVPPPPPAIEKRIDIGVEKHVGFNSGIDVNSGAGVSNVYTEQLSIQRPPSTFFQDIFNIPISTLKAVGSFLGNTAGSTNISVQKSASIHAGDTNSEGAHEPSPSSKSSSSSAQISVATPSASKFIDDIFADTSNPESTYSYQRKIPINTLGAVNRFLENNVARKNVQVQETEDIPTRVRRIPHRRRKANRKVIVVQDDHTSDTQ